jgi:hypothetical protein
MRRRKFSFGDGLIDEEVSDLGEDWAKHADAVLADKDIIDNIPAHRVPGMREEIESVGATPRYLPPNSPDLNLIQLTFSKIMTHLRKAAEPAWSRDWCNRCLPQSQGMCQLGAARNVVGIISGSVRNRAARFCESSTFALCSSLRSWVC